MASSRKSSTASRSDANMSGCWSYLVEMYCLTALDRFNVVPFRKGIYANSEMLLGGRDEQRGSSGVCGTYRIDLFGWGLELTSDWY
jgi:hypothetical protein